MAEVKDMPSSLVMDDAAQRLGAHNHQAFLRVASPSMKCAFKLICLLIMKHEYGPEGVWRDAA